MLCFDKFTGEHNNKKHFLIFPFCGSISLNTSNNNLTRCHRNALRYGKLKVVPYCDS